MVEPGYDECISALKPLASIIVAVPAVLSERVLLCIKTVAPNP